jgi:hypothetical protein
MYGSEPENSMSQSKSRWLLSTVATLIIVAACGGGQSQAPAEAPTDTSTEPAPEPAPSEATDAGMPEGEHTMPDGSTMPGHEH